MSSRISSGLVVLLIVCVPIISPRETSKNLLFGQVYGSAIYLSNDASGMMADAPATVLVFTAKDGHRNLVLTQQTGDYIALLERGRYCLAAYTRAGKPVKLAKNQLRCVNVENGEDVRLDVMLVRDKE
jgi:hypothetical protein